MAKTETNVSTLKINRGTYAKVQENLSSISENELIITSDKNVPIPTTNDSGKAVVVNASGEYELGNAGASQVTVLEAYLTNITNREERCEIFTCDISTSIDWDDIIQKHFNGEVILIRIVQFNNDVSKQTRGIINIETANISIGKRIIISGRLNTDNIAQAFSPGYDHVPIYEYDTYCEVDLTNGAPSSIDIKVVVTPLPKTVFVGCDKTDNNLVYNITTKVGQKSSTYNSILSDKTLKTINNTSLVQAYNAGENISIPVVTANVSTLHHAADPLESLQVNNNYYYIPKVSKDMFSLDELIFGNTYPYHLYRSYDIPNLPTPYAFTVTFNESYIKHLMWTVWNSANNEENPVVGVTLFMYNSLSDMTSNGEYSGDDFHDISTDYDNFFLTIQGMCDEDGDFELNSNSLMINSDISDLINNPGSNFPSYIDVSVDIFDGHLCPLTKKFTSCCFAVPIYEDSCSPANYLAMIFHDIPNNPTAFGSSPDNYVCRITSHMG